MRLNVEMTLTAATAKRFKETAERLANLNLGDDGLLRDLAQAGWRISVLEYQAVGEDRLPRRLFLTAGDFQLRLVIDRWEWL